MILIGIVMGIVISLIFIIYSIKIDRKEEFVIKGTDKFDKFGILEIYPTKINGREWFVNMIEPYKDARFEIGSKIFRQMDGSWQIGSDENLNKSVRMNVGTLNGEEEWKNVEITGYIKVVNADLPYDSLVWYARGDKHNDEFPCKGTALKGRIYVDGIVSWVKEIWHPGGYTKEKERKQITETIVDRWIGWKVAIYNINNNTAVKMESFIDDKANNNWKKVTEVVDHGDWYAKAPDNVFYSKNCSKYKNHILAESGPIITYRSDNMIWNFKNLSVREIQPTN